MPIPYRTVARRGCAELIEKKSRFLAVAVPVSSEEEVQSILAETRREHRDASHHTYAYRLGQNAASERFSDDGEPSGTAGLPLLTLLRGEQVADGLLVVTRYFGGTLLGTGGLTRAYGGAAKLALAEAGIARMEPFRRFAVCLPYPLLDLMRRDLPRLGAVEESAAYTEKIRLIILCPLEREEWFRGQLINLCQGQAGIEARATVYRRAETRNQRAEKTDP